MTATGLLIFAAAYVMAAASPGPGVAALVARVLARGTQGTPSFIAGFIVGDLMWFGIAATGLAVLAQTFAALLLVIRYVEAAVAGRLRRDRGAHRRHLMVMLASYTLAAARARRLFTSPRAVQTPNRGTGAVMAGAAIAVAAR